MTDDLIFHDHLFNVQNVTKERHFERAQGVWLNEMSEIPHHEGLLGCTPVKNHSGLFTVLIQRPECQVRALSGRYLRLA